MPASGPGPKARVKNSAQISMSTERMEVEEALEHLVERAGSA